MSKNLKAALITLSLILIVFFSLRNRLNWEHNKSSIADQRAHQLEIDENVVAHPDKVDPAAIYAAEIRLSIKPSEADRKNVFALTKSKVPLVRGGAAFFLANQNDSDSIALFKEILKDSDPTVRENIAKGFNYNPDPTRAVLIREFLASGAISDQARVQAISALYRAVPTQDEKNTVLKTLIEFGAQEKNPVLSQLAVLELCNLAPQNEAVTELLRKSVSRKQKQVVPVAIRTLAVKRDLFLLENAERLAFDPDIEVKRAVVESLQYLCPISRYSILQKGFRDEKSAELRRTLWLAEAEKLPGDQGDEFYAKLEKEYAKGGSEELMMIKASAGRSRSSGLKDPCQAAK
jgi:hypothetical protein